jgi:hypothetical protein
LNNVSFPRSLTPPNTIGLLTLCIFADASRDAFGTCSYLRWEISNGNYESRFISAKSRVAPLKELTIPRLELQAAVLATRWEKRQQIGPSIYNFMTLVWNITKLPHRIELAIPKNRIVFVFRFCYIWAGK